VLTYTAGFGNAWSQQPTIGTNGGTQGQLSLSGSTSGTVAIATSSAAGTYTFMLPTTVGTSGYALTSSGSSASPTTWTSVATNPMTTTGDIIYSSNNSGTPARLGIGSSGYYLTVSSGLPAWQTVTAPVLHFLESTGTTAGYLFTISTSSTVVKGDTYTNNTNTYTVLNSLTATSGQVLYMSGASAPTASGNLSRSTGSGTATIAFTSNLALASITVGSTARMLRVLAIGGGGGGAGTTGASNGNAAAGGASGSWLDVTYVPVPTGALYYAIGGAGTKGSAGANAGTGGGLTTWVDSNGVYYQAPGGGGGPTGSSCNSTTAVFCTGNSSPGGAPTTNSLGPHSNGIAGLPGLVLQASQVLGGMGASSPFGGGGFGGQGTAAGSDAAGYGAGGGGGGSASGGGSTAGGNGTAGFIETIEYFNGN
jgi:hypothetical protein